MDAVLPGVIIAVGAVVLYELRGMTLDWILGELQAMRLDGERLQDVAAIFLPGFGGQLRRVILPDEAVILEAMERDRHGCRARESGAR